MRKASGERIICTAFRKKHRLSSALLWRHPRSPRNHEGELMSRRKLTVDAELEKLQHESFKYFLHETNPVNGLVIDKTAADWPASIAATGLALASYPVAVEHGFMTHAAAVERTLTTLRFFWNSPQGPEPDVTGYRGFYYHFLDMQSGRRAWQCELSTVDSAFLLAGGFIAGGVFFFGGFPQALIPTTPPPPSPRRALAMA